MQEAVLRFQANSKSELLSTDGVNVSHQFGFGEALQALAEGCHVTRHAWRNKGNFLYLIKGKYNGGNGGPLDGVPLSLFTPKKEGANTRFPCIAVRTPSGARNYGWVPSQSDMFAEDWEEVEIVGRGEEEA